MAGALACGDGAGPDDVPSVRYTSVVASGAFTCALSDAGNPYCWGDASFVSDSVPRPLGSPEPLRTIAAGTQPFAGSVCGIATSGRVFCWGTYRHGYDGGGSYGNRVDPVEITGANGMTSIAVADGHACGILPDSTVSCWGSYVSGKRGRLFPDPMSLSDQAATPAEGGLKFAQLAAGAEFTCGTLTDGQVACWGDSANVGRPAATFVHDENPCWITAVCTTTPVAAEGLAGALKVAAGFQHACALAATGLKCWGYNYAGQLGSAVGEYSGVPVPVTVPGAAIELVAGGYHGCALVDGGAAYCWGGLSLAPSTPGGPSPPVKVEAGSARFVGLSAGAWHTCGITEEGALYCWGASGRALGDGTGKPSATPVRVAEPRR